MRALFLFALIAGSTFAATIPPQIDSNVLEMSAMPVSDAFDVIFNQARSAVIGLYNLITIPFSILANSQQMMMPNEARSVDPIRGVVQATNHALQRAGDSINTVLTNAHESDSDPLFRIFQQVVGKRMKMVEGVNDTTTSSTMQSLPLFQRLLTFSDRANSK